MNDIETICNIMIGHSTNSIELVVMTPLKSTYKKIIKELNKNGEFYEKCFFENFVYETKIGKVMIVLSPQGLASNDIVELFNNTNFLFFGLAGSLNDIYRVGDFVEVKEAYYFDEKSSLKLIADYRKVICGYSPCMIGEIADKYCRDAKDKSCDVVDMETSVCAKTAKKHNDNFTSLLLISDIPGKYDFWKLSDEMKNKLANCRKKTIKIIIKYINYIIEGGENKNE